MERKEARRLCARSGHSICTPPRARWLLYLRPDVHPLDAGIRWRKSARSVGKECPELSVVGYHSFSSISSNKLPRYEKRNRRDPVPFFVGERPLSPCQLLWLPSKAVFRAQMAHFSFFGCMVPQTGHFTRFSSASAAKSFTSLHCGQQ